MVSRSERVLHWFRSDLRVRDNRALRVAAGRARELVLLFVLDDRLLRGAALGAPRLHFLLGCLDRLAAALEGRGQRLVVRRGDPTRLLPELLREWRIERITWNHDYGPFARRRDVAVRRAAEALGVAVESQKDRVVFESEELRTKTGTPFQVYTPYRNAWWARFEADPPLVEAAPRLPPPIAEARGEAIPSAASLGFADAGAELPTPGEDAAARRLDRFVGDALARYAVDRDRPDVDGTSRLSPYLRFGAISIRTCVHAALDRARADRGARVGAQKWADELVWRDFYHAILAAHPHVLTRSFRPEYEALEWNDDAPGFRAWCEGRTGYPFVDAAMRQLAATGWMHNRARMVVASFLTKDLLIDWRRGERFFYQRLVDGDPASNNGGWQWAASTGTDAQPYFRIFHPVSQGERWDPEGRYVRRWVPELAEVEPRFLQRPWEAASPPRHYPRPIVDHAERRALALRRFEKVKQNGPAGGGSDRASRRKPRRRGDDLDLF
jgi:deoxyribodipyrimidine photo-lyase